MSTEHFVTYDDERIPYSIVRSDRRTLAITVARDGTVRVRAPRRTPYAEIVRLVPAKSAWIARKRRDLVSRAAEVPV
ncbi:MAG: YgjP-like metallopeptidase domain-containing protein, partial [Coriobacteriia bacterium]|nr:YgjP-like metallopeptidase domain-containing protein [Coriobacteriia bacterium]